MTRSHTALALLGSAALLAGCGATAQGPGPAPQRRAPVALRQGYAGRERDACALSTPASVASVFAARAATEGPGPFPGTCAYRLDGGRSSQVYVSDLGRAWTWRRLRAFYARTRGELTAVPLVGTAAFSAEDERGVEVVVRMPRRIFTVVAANGPDPAIAGAAVELARRVAKAFPARMPLLARPR
jgi:hypothetical protein